MSQRTQYIREKDPDDVWPFGFDWTNQLPTGETVSTAVWAVTSPSGDSTPVVVDTSSISGAVTTAVISAGTAGNTYQLRCRITTANYTRDWTFDLVCRAN